MTGRRNYFSYLLHFFCEKELAINIALGQTYVQDYVIKAKTFFEWFGFAHCCGHHKLEILYMLYILRTRTKAVIQRTKSRIIEYIIIKYGQTLEKM